MILADFRCEEHGVFEATVPSDAETMPCPQCGASSAWSPSPVATHTAFVVSATRGKSDPPPTPQHCDTRPLMEGQGMREWKRDRSNMWRDHDRNQRKGRA